MIETANGLQAITECALAGVAEWRMAEIVGERQRLGQILIEAERTRQRAGDLDNFQGMGEPGSIMVALMEDEDLGLMFQPAEGG